MSFLRLFHFFELHEIENRTSLANLGEFCQKIKKAEGFPPALFHFCFSSFSFYFFASHSLYIF
jgi:hypothetical protein